MPATTTTQNGDRKFPMWSPMLTASNPRWAVEPTAAAALAVTNPCTTHWPPLDGMKTATIELAMAVSSGNVSGVDTAAKTPEKRSPPVVYCSNPATPP